MDHKEQTLSKLKLNKLSVNELDKRSMKTIKGGTVAVMMGAKKTLRGILHLEAMAVKYILS